MVTLEDMLLLAALLCVLMMFVNAVSYRFRRNSPEYNPGKEISAHIIAGGDTAIFIIASEIFNKPEFKTFGVAMLTIMVIYYMFTILEIDTKEDV